MTGRRGPVSGSGGRPTYTLGTDPDRLIVITAIWFWDAIGSNPLQFLDAIFSGDDAVKFDFDTLGRLGIVNTRAEREPEWRTYSDVERNIAPDRRHLTAPNGDVLRKTRIDQLRRKVARYREMGLSAEDAQYCRAVMDGWFMLQATGDIGPLLSILNLDDRARDRLRKILAGFLEATRPTPAQSQLAHPAPPDRGDE
jgi:hypothetical protein